MDAQTDPVAEAKAIVEAYLERSMVPDPEGAAAYVAEDFQLVFTGGRRFSGPADSSAFNAKRYAWVKKKFLRTDAALDAETGDVHVYNTGYLYGEWKDGSSFETNRYMDKFIVRDGKIVATDVWNDSAEILLHKAGLAEADLQMLTTHGRYAYSAITARPDYDWPGGKRLAVYVGLNLEHFAFGEGLGAELAPGGPQPDVLNYPWRDYGNRVGAWRMRDMFDALDMPVSVLANSAMYDYAPELMAAFRARGDEIVGHGRTNSERQSVLQRSAEAALIADATEVLTRAEGTPPQGWLSPWIAESHHTPDLLAEAGYGYTLNWCMDDQPVWMQTSAGRLLAIPYPQEVNDIPAIVARKDSAAQFADMIIDNFDEMLEQSAAQPLVMGIALHPYLVGQPYRLRHLRRALRHICAHRGDIWLTTSGAIHHYCRDTIPDRIV